MAGYSATGSEDKGVLLERLFLRLACANSDAQVQSFVDKNLVHVLKTICELGTSQEIVQKGIGLIQHLNKRIKTNDQIRLPVAELIGILDHSGQANAVLLTNLCGIYVKKGFLRLDPEERLQLLPSLLATLKIKSKQHQNTILGIALSTVCELHKIDKAKWPALNLTEYTKTVFLDFWYDFLLLTTISTSDVGGQGDPQENMSRVLPSGLSRAGLARVSNLVHSYTELEQRKTAIVKFLGNAEFAPAEIAYHLIMAMADSVHSVVTAAELEWRKLFGSSSIEDKKLLAKLFEIYTGTVDSKVVPDEDKKQAANVRQRLKIFPLFLRSNTAAAFLPQNVQMTFGTLFGNSENPVKLKLMAVEFVALIINRCPQNAVGTFAPILFSGLKKLLDKESDAKLLSQTFLSMGKVGLKCTQLVVTDMQFIQSLFELISSCHEDVSYAVVECLSMWLPIFQSAAETSRNSLEALVSTYVTHENSKCRLVAIKYLSCVFDETHTKSRWLLLNACADSREEVKKEAQRILTNSAEARKLPPFAEMASFVGTKLEDRTSPLKQETLDSTSLFLHGCLLSDSGCAPSLDPPTVDYNDSPKIAEFIYSALKTDREAISTALKSYETVLLKLCRMQQEAWSFILLTEITVIIGSAMVTVVAEHLEWLLQLVYSSPRLDVCPIAAELLSHVLINAFSEKVPVIIAEISSLSESDPAPGKIWLLGYLLALIKKQPDPKSIAFLSKKIDYDRPNFTTESACGALSEVLRASSLQFDSENEEAIVVIEKLGKLAQTRREIVNRKLKERAVGALGFITTGKGDAEKDLRERIKKLLFEIGEGPPQPDFQFAVGEALLCLALRGRAIGRRNRWTESEQSFVNKTEDMCSSECDDLTALLEEILNDKLIAPNRHLRQAAVIWLFVISKYCSYWHPAVISRLDLVQNSFIDALADGNEFTQDIASKGLDVVYENGTSVQKERMVSLLVSSLSTGRKSTRPVTGDTKIFERGSLGSAPGGDGLSTYRELCALATDLNQPDLVYKFMHLANHNAMWNSKKGAAFGFASVLKQAQEQIEPYLPQMVPKLYRYQYDPDMKIQTSMKAIWQALTSSRKGVVDEHAVVILNELIKTLTDSQWRVRESSCLAISDLLSGHHTAAMTDRFVELWLTLFRVKDDIKESVRLAAGRALTTLHKVTVKYCKSERGESASNLIGEILPVLLDKGMHTKVSDIRGLSLLTLIALGKESGEALRPHFAVLIPSLLEALSEIEPSVLNYLAVRSTAEEQEQLDSARAAAAKTSPVMDTLNQCLRYLDDDSLKALIPSLCEMLRGSVGLGTKTGTCSFVVSLCVHCQREMYAVKAADKFLKALVHGLSDRNATVRKQYASAIGYLAKFTTHAAMENFIRKCSEWQLLEDGNVVKNSCGHALRSLGVQNPELLKDFGPEIAPFVFMATVTEEAKNTKEKKEQSSATSVWQDVWSELTPGTDGGIRLYRSEIVAYCCNLLKENPQWGVKSNAANALRIVVKSAASQMTQSESESLLSFLLDCLAGRTWDGKEEVLRAIAQLTSLCSRQLAESDSLKKRVQTVLVAECNKKKVSYKTVALESAGIAWNSLRLPFMSELLSSCKSILSKESSLFGSDGEDEGKNESAEKIAVQSEFRSAAFEAIAAATSVSDSDAEVKEVLSLMFAQLASSYWKVQLSILMGCLKIIHSNQSVQYEWLPDSSLQVIADLYANASQEILWKSAKDLLELEINRFSREIATGNNTSTVKSIKEQASYEAAKKLSEKSLVLLSSVGL